MQFDDFKQAASFARAEAVRAGKTVPLQKMGSVWVVEGEVVRAEATTAPVLGAGQSLTPQMHGTHEPQRAAQQMRAEQEGLARSEKEQRLEHYAPYSTARIDALVSAKHPNGDWVLDRKSPEFHAVREIWRRRHPEVLRRDPVVYKIEWDYE